jgi:hypothetical protein
VIRHVDLQAKVGSSLSLADASGFQQDGAGDERVGRVEGGAVLGKYRRATPF